MTGFYYNKVLSSIKIICFVLSLNLLYCQLKAQNNFVIKFIPVLGNTCITPGTNYYLNGISDSVNIETFRFYVSNITFLKNQKVVYKAKNQFFLLDVEGKMEIKLTGLPKFDADALQFNLGIDSITNVSGAMGGDLDPTKGMYWAWQSGYINFKLEGSSKVCNTRNHKFQFHVGGYSYPYNTIQQISLPLNNNQLSNISIDLESFLIDVILSKNNEVMSPNNTAMELASKFKTVFKLK